MFDLICWSFYLSDLLQSMVVIDCNYFDLESDWMSERSGSACFTWLPCWSWLIAWTVNQTPEWNLTAIGMERIEVAGSSARSTSHDVASPVRVASFFSDSDDDEDLLETMTTPKSQSKANGVLDRRPDTNSSTLFGDESSDAGIFVPPLLPSQPKDEVRAADEKKASLESSLFDEDSDEDIFGTSWHKLPKTAESQSASPTLKKDPPTSPRSTVTVARPSEEKNGAKKSALFDEDSDDELFSNSQKPQSKSDFRPISPAVAKTSLPDQLPSAGSTATVAAPSGDKKEVKESTLFDEDSDEEIFSKTSQKPKAIVESHSKSPVEATLRHQPPSSGSTATATVPSGEGNGLNKSVLDQPTSSSPDKNAADSFIGEKVRKKWEKEWLVYQLIISPLTIALESSNFFHALL